MEVKYIDYKEYFDGFGLENFLSKDECLDFIKMSEDIGYEEIKMRPDANRNMRTNKVIFHYDLKLANNLFERVRGFLPEINGLMPTSCNEKIKFYRYSANERFRRHRDSHHINDNNERSFLSFLIYLNDGFVGGGTKFIRYNVTPKMGSALIFRHDHRHEGSVIKSGTKYVLRTDIMYPAI